MRQRQLDRTTATQEEVSVLAHRLIEAVANLETMTPAPEPTPEPVRKEIKMLFGVQDIARVIMKCSKRKKTGYIRSFLALEICKALLES